MNKHLIALSRCGNLRMAFRALRLHRLYNWWLWHFPRTKVLPGSGTIYRCRWTETVATALEILEGGRNYDEVFIPTNCRTVVDLGSNVGLFTCWLAHHTGNRKLKGLLVDANPEVCAEARWHVETNLWPDLHVLQGVVGMPGKQQSDFFVHEANTVSTAQLTGVQLTHRADYKQISVPVLCIREEWCNRFGAIPCDVLKLDIEGCELDFLSQERDFLHLVNTLFVEWHRIRVEFADLDHYLTSCGFKLLKNVPYGTEEGTAVYRRVTNPNPSMLKEGSK